MFHPLKVKKITKETSSSVSIVFDVPEELKGEFNFLPGQFLTLKHHINGKEVRRSYSLCSTPKSGELKIAIKKVDGGVFSSFAVNQLKENDFIDVAVPAGKFTVQCKSNQKGKYVFIAVGSGITPIMSMVKTILNEEPFSSVELLYGNKTKSETIFFEEIEAMVQLHQQRFNVNYFLSVEDPGTVDSKGRIGAEKISKIHSQWGELNDVIGFYLCGPKLMVDEVSTYLKNNLAVPSNKVHFELFYLGFRRKYFG